MMITHTPRDLAALATAAYGDTGWVVAIAECEVDRLVRGLTR